ncbi:MAG: FHA domain-containing protein [Gammaproteobacteria bacterium]|jgi:pSer/pThr/pTyr-binding forkhead associated (FHA) protein
MSVISIVKNNQPVKSIPLPEGGISIGRSGENDIFLNDETISARHAKIYTYYNTSYIEDLDSTNGTYINGKKIQKHLIKPGDVVQIGQHKFNIEA